MHPTELAPEELLRDCDVRRSRRGGPGGQHRNKVETAVTVTHRPTGVTGDASERRSQQQNQTIAVRRLRVALALAIRTDRDERDTPSDLWRSRCRNGRVSVNADHDDFATLLAEAMDVIAACDDDLSSAAERLTCSTSQLIKLLKAEPRAMESVNAARDARGLHRLR
ncbi:MAG: peptide chain release factor-like protein [Phycisphaera sp.]|nr:peptide chain release factor-like protein [Phycisphaera sp.]